MRLLWWVPGVLVAEVNAETTQTTTHLAELKKVSYCQGEQLIWRECDSGVPCKNKTKVDCELDEWGPWSDCLCDGLKERNRGIKHHNNEVGAPCSGNTTETAPCKIDCLKQPQNCQIGDWSEWGECIRKDPSTNETVAESFRTRTVTPPKDGGKPCNVGLKEARGCEVSNLGEHNRSCKWGDWSGWSACTCECGGGQKTRDRSVAVAPRGSGARCAAPNEFPHKTEVAPCNTQSCEKDCVDGTWGDWGDWTKCSAPCEGGTQFRHRSVNKTAEGCGKAPTGEYSQVQECNLQGCEEDRDCKLGDWSEWSACSCSCDGIMHRHRQIRDYGAGQGLFCETSTKEVVECHFYSAMNGSSPLHPECSGKPPVDCKFGGWTDVGGCSASCDGGQQNQKRDIVQVHAFGGNPCNGPLERTTECNMEPCNDNPPLDCQWAAWDEWSACDKCSGEMKRTRTIARMPENLGRPCHFEASEQITNCSRGCHSRVVCDWTEWAEEEGCSAVCGVGRKKMRRILQAKELNETNAATKYDAQQPTIAQSRLQNLTVSFACGSLVTFLVLVVTMRAFRGESQSHQLVRAAE